MGGTSSYSRTTWSCTKEAGTCVSIMFYIFHQSWLLTFFLWRWWTVESEKIVLPHLHHQLQSSSNDLKTELSDLQRWAPVLQTSTNSASLFKKRLSLYTILKLVVSIPTQTALKIMVLLQELGVESCNAQGVCVEFNEDMLKLVSITILSVVISSTRSLHTSLPMHLRSVASSRPSHGLWLRPHMESIWALPSARSEI